MKSFYPVLVDTVEKIKDNLLVMTIYDVDFQWECIGTFVKLRLPSFLLKNLKRKLEEEQYEDRIYFQRRTPT